MSASSATYLAPFYTSVLNLPSFLPPCGILGQRSLRWPVAQLRSIFQTFHSIRHQASARGRDCEFQNIFSFGGGEQAKRCGGENEDKTGDTSSCNCRTFKRSISLFVRPSRIEYKRTSSLPALLHAFLIKYTSASTGFTAKIRNPTPNCFARTGRATVRVPGCSPKQECMAMRERTHITVPTFALDFVVQGYFVQLFVTDWHLAPVFWSHATHRAKQTPVQRA